MTRCEEQLKNIKNPNAQTVGQIILAIYGISSQAKEIIEQDLTVEDMSISKCFKKIEDYAKANKNGNCFSSAVFGIDAENPIIKIILDFYKVPSELLQETQDIQVENRQIQEPQESSSVSFWDLMGD